jgi:hypothetical protein
MNRLILSKRKLPFLIKNFTKEALVTTFLGQTLRSLYNRCASCAYTRVDLAIE